MALAVEAGLRRDPALVVGMNEPYSPDDRVFTRSTGMPCGGAWRR